MPLPEQRGLTFKAKFIKEIEEFIDKHPELGWAAVPEAIRYAWNKFVAEYKDKIGTDFLNTKQNFVNDLIIILLNGRNIRFLKGKKTKLSDNDKIYLSLPVSGG